MNEWENKTCSDINIPGLHLLRSAKSHQSSLLPFSYSIFYYTTHELETILILFFFVTFDYKLSVFIE